MHNERSSRRISLLWGSLIGGDHRSGQRCRDSGDTAIVDAMRVPHVVGRDVALAALSRYTRQAGANPLRPTALARQLGGERRIREALEVILA